MKHTPGAKSYSSLNGNEFLPMGSESSYTSNDSHNFERASRNYEVGEANQFIYGPQVPLRVQPVDLNLSKVMTQAPHTNAARPLLEIKSKQADQTYAYGGHGFPLSENSIAMQPTPRWDGAKVSHSDLKRSQVVPNGQRMDDEADEEEVEEDDDESEEEEEDEDEDEEDESEEDESDDCSYTSESSQLRTAKQHPYYEEWKQYYAQLAMQQQQQQQQHQGISQRSSYPDNIEHPAQCRGIARAGYAPNLSHSHQSQRGTRQSSDMSISTNQSSSVESREISRRPSMKNDFISSFNLRQSSYKASKLLQKTRHSAAKSKRYPSLPSLISESEVSGYPNRRVSSLDVNFKPDIKSASETGPTYRFNSPDNNDKTLEGSSNNSSFLQDYYGASNESVEVDKERVGSVSYRLSDLKLEQLPEERHISDYNRYFFEEPESEKEDNTILPDRGSETSGDIKGSQDSNSKSSSNDLIERESSSKFQVDSAESFEDNSGNRKSTAVPNFFDYSQKRNVEVAERRRKKMTRSFYSTSALDTANRASMAAPLGVWNQGQPLPNSQAFGQGPNYGVSGYFTKRNRQSIATVDDKRMSLGFNQMNSYDLGSKPLPAPLSMPAMINDSLSNQKVINFLKLRQAIADGKKSYEYRLRWAKMLMEAINYRLYSYIDIKGQRILTEKTNMNKGLFVKSAMNHISKLLRDCESNKIENDLAVEIYYVYACLLKHDYVNKFYQDYNIQKDVPLAEEYFKKCLDLNSSDFKSLYKLGELYEYEYDFDGQFDTALDYYKTSAKIGYNKAIYKIALLYLNVSKVRSLKFFKYLSQLSNIEPKQAHLDQEDQEELQEVVGLASYELGKIYEGVYPGDLTGDDPFVQRALEMAPVNYGRSLTCYNKAAKMNCLLAQVKLGTIYEYGDLNRQRNPSKSIVWYLKASCSPLPFKRHPDAMLGLSRWYLVDTNKESKYIPKPDPKKAEMWCERALKEFDIPEAYFQMGYLAEIGIVKSDPKEWYDKAQELHHPGATSKLV
ncbi:uncharacterized protein PRCAT00005751001 [Priceomyces carsonii]|uniref:uncharacterized protein n=1 Tax=Priceomyces carsonii TaxID=28549 RepID=UPI002EDAE3F1|nr:unnamed protein product [Priceomyces carsonii]